MGKRMRTSGYHARFSDLRSLRLPLLCVFFAFGAILGHVLPQLIGGDSELASQLRSYAAVGADAELSVSLLSVVVLYLRYPLLVLLFGYYSFSAVAIPLLLAFQGFTLSFSVASLAAALGRQGVFLALAAFGLRSILTVVCSLLLALAMLERTNGNNEAKTKSSGNVIALCFLLLAVGIVLELTVMPKLFTLVLGMLK